MSFPVRLCSELGTQYLVVIKIFLNSSIDRPKNCPDFAASQCFTTFVLKFCNFAEKTTSELVFFKIIRMIFFAEVPIRKKQIQLSKWNFRFGVKEKRDLWSRCFCQIYLHVKTKVMKSRKNVHCISKVLRLLFISSREERLRFSSSGVLSVPRLQSPTKILSSGAEVLFRFLEFASIRCQDPVWTFSSLKQKKKKTGCRYSV